MVEQLPGHHIEKISGRVRLMKIDIVLFQSKCELDGIVVAKKAACEG